MNGRVVIYAELSAYGGLELHTLSIASRIADDGGLPGEESGESSGEILDIPDETGDTWSELMLPLSVRI